MSWMGVDDVCSVYYRDLGVDPALSGRNRQISSTAPLTGSKGRLGFRRRVKFTTEEARSYNTRGSELQGREREISVVHAWRVEATVPQERLACGRTRVLAAMREATVVPVCNTTMKSKASVVIERSECSQRSQHAGLLRGG